MDGLHDGLDCNPFDQQSHGCKFTLEHEAFRIASLGYADDTTILTNTLPDLTIQNNWVEYFMRFNCLRLNPLKCELVGRGPDGESITVAQLTTHGFTIDGRSVIPKPHDQPIRYLGVHMCFDGNWKAQQKKTQATIFRFTRLIDKFQLSIGHAIYMYNVFLTPRLELALHYVHGTGTTDWIETCDKIIIGSIKHAAGSLLRLSKSALATSLHLLLPSWLEQCVKVSELFIRMNSSDPRWGRLGRQSMRQQYPSNIDEHTEDIRRPNSGTQITRAVYLAVKKLKWSLHLHHHRKRHLHLFDTPAHTSLPTLADCSSTMLLDLTQDSIHVVHDCWSGWSVPPTMNQPNKYEVHVYTDGSHDSSTSTSSWSVVVGDRWFDDNFGFLPNDEDELIRQPRHLGGSTRFGSSVSNTIGVYPVELQAIARVLAMFPLDTILHIHSDSQASIKSIKKFIGTINERDRLRSAARPLLQLIDHLCKRRKAAGGDLCLNHVSATMSINIVSVIV